MNRTPATRYRAAARLAFMKEPPPLSSSAKADDPVFRNSRDLQNRHGILGAPPARGMTISIRESPSRSLLFLLVHREHPLRHQKAAENIHRRENQRDEAEAAGPGPAAADHLDADREQRADHDHGGDRIGHRHQRRMQRGGHRPHHEIADEHGKHEDRQSEDEGIHALGDMLHGCSPYAFGWKFGWITAPSLVSAVAFTSSSSHFTSSALVVLSTMVSMKLNKLRA